MHGELRAREQPHAAVFTASFWDSVPSLGRADCSPRSLVGPARRNGEGKASTVAVADSLSTA
jgi:hypothetical protein